MTAEKLSAEKSAGRAYDARFLSRVAHGLLAGLGVLALIRFMLLLSHKYWQPGFCDFDQIYMAGLAWRRGVVPYGVVEPAFHMPNGPDSHILQAYYYTPLGSMLAAPLSLLSFPRAIFLWKIGAFALLLYGVWRFSRLTLPDWPLSLHLFGLGVTALASSVRWNLLLLQPTALIVGGLLLFACAVIEERWTSALLLAVLISIKPSFFLPVVGLLAFRGRYRLLGLALGAILLLNLVALAPTGPRRTLAAYAEAIRSLDRPGTENDPRALESLGPYLNMRPDSPLAHHPQWSHKRGFWAEQQLSGVFLLSAWLPTLWQARALHGLLTLLALGLLARLWWRAQVAQRYADPAFLAALFALLTGLALLSVYHRRYDALGLIPAVYVVLAMLHKNPRDLAAWAALGAGGLGAYVLAAGMVNLWLSRLVVPYGLLFLTPVFGYLTLAVCVALFVALWRESRSPVQARTSTSAAGLAGAAL
ncbi:MAG TPA: glycosyltransferase family 87 protein [Chthonomonadaceae bacterium]|nr:glycosyltransferase family 87 protein [Chthonomonadaceae bacterium]